MFEVADFKGKKAYLDTSLIYIQKAVDVYPQYTEGWNNLGSVYGKMQQYDNAIAAFNKALEIEPDNETSKRYLDLTYQLQKAANEDHFTKGVQLIEQRDFQSAAIEFEKAILKIYNKKLNLYTLTHVKHCVIENNLSKIEEQDSKIN